MTGFCARSSGGQSNGFLIRRSQVRVLPGVMHPGAETTRDTLHEIRYTIFEIRFTRYEIRNYLAGIVVFVCLYVNYRINYVWFF